MKEFAEQARQEGLGFVSGKGLVTSLEEAVPLDDGVPINDVYVSRLQLRDELIALCWRQNFSY
mgnify:CR=1 FL=1